MPKEFSDEINSCVVHVFTCMYSIKLINYVDTLDTTISQFTTCTTTAAALLMDGWMDR